MKMGKASRKKREQKNGCGVAACNSKLGLLNTGVEFGIEESDMNKVFEEFAISALIKGFQDDDVDAALNAIWIVEKTSGKSIFDHVFNIKLSNAVVNKASVIMLASCKLAEKCTVTLLRMAWESSIPVASDWMVRSMFALENHPKEHELCKFIVRVMEDIMEPRDMEFALISLKRAESGFYLPKTAELARNLANRFIANQQQYELENVTPGNRQGNYVRATVRL